MDPARQPGALQASAPGNWPGARVAWAGVAMLMVANVLSLADRQVLSLLVEPIRGSLGLSDLQIAVLQGPAFMVSYTLLGFPFGWLVDRTHRIRLLAAGLALWSVACAACGLMHSFESLAIARMFVGVGEAVLAPAALSLIADWFAPERRPLAMSVQSAASTAGIGVAMLAGGSVIAIARSQPEVSLPGVGTMDTWRFVFLACGVPGLFFAALLLALTPEPARQQAQRRAAAPDLLLPFMRRARTWMLSQFAAISATALVGYGFMAWSPTYLVRRHGWSIADAAFLLGALFTVLGSAGTVFAGWLARRWRARGELDATLRVCRLAAIGTTFSIGAFALDPGIGATVLLLACSVFFIAMTPGVAAAALQEVTPDLLRGRVAAAYYITTNLVGASLGPVVAAGVTQLVLHDPTQIGLSLAILALVGCPLTAVLLTVALPAFRELARPPGPPGLAGPPPV